jgi:hypothetical protein
MNTFFYALKKWPGTLAAKPEAEKERESTGDLKWLGALATKPEAEK